MKYELYIFNKSDAKGLSRWDSSEQNPTQDIEILYSSNKFKARKSELNKLNDFLAKISNQFRENPKLLDFFRDYFNSSIYVNIYEDFHHLSIFETESEKLVLDSELNSELAPLYLFSFYFYLSRKIAKLSEDEIYSILPDFFLAFEANELDKLESSLAKHPGYDAGNHFLIWLKKIRNKNSDPYKATQLLRNRVLAGTMPYRIERYEEITELHTKTEQGCFGGDAIEEYFESLKEDLQIKESEFQAYYQHLLFALRTLGLKVVAQRGSRVAHEQGPILINSGTISLSEDIELEIKKLRSNLISTLVKISELVEDFNITETLNKSELAFNIVLDELLYLSNKNNSPKARYEKVLIELNKETKNYFDTVFKALDAISHDISQYLNLYDELRELERSLLHSFLDLKQLLDSSPENRECSVIFVQRPSSRSGHFIPRILIGENLYVETDSESEEHRLKALPFNFVSPEFSYIASGVDSFFENASISIVTDKDTGKPDIKWSNAEDLAISLAPDFYTAICGNTATAHRFHYQLETTLIGPLIDLFRYLLEDEISNIASIEIAGEEAKKSIAELVKKYQSEVVKAADFCFGYYLLDDYLEDYITREGCSKLTAIFEILPQLSDVQNDVAAYCLCQRKGNIDEVLKLKQELETQNLSYSEKAKLISAKLTANTNKSEIRNFIKKYIRYGESTARKELLSANKKYPRITITSDKANPDADFYYDFTVAPSRIDFGKHVVASVTSLMGRMLGADDLESLSIGKNYIDLVSKCRNSLFETSAEAGSAKVAENSCRAVQYAKAISFQGMFQSLGNDGQAIRRTINSRDNKAVGIHIMEHGTMASTGYCITKEPLFILLALSLDSEEVLEKIGISDTAARTELRSLIEDLLKRRPEFMSSLDWQLYAYEELSHSDAVRKYLSDPDFPWIPNIYALTNLCKQLSKDADAQAEKGYSVLASKLIEYSRLLNETGIIQRIQIMNNAVRRALILQQEKDFSPNNQEQGSNTSFDEKLKQRYANLKIAFNAAYKGNVSDERENANQYLIALLLRESRYLKNASEASVAKLLEHQFNNYPLPGEIRICDPLVDPDVFMGGELKYRAENCEQEIIHAFRNSKQALTQETLSASVKTYGSDILKWPAISKRLKAFTEAEKELIITKLESLESSLKYYELYQKGFYKNPLRAYQGVDVIQLNAEHDELIAFMEDLVIVKRTMKVNNPESLLVLIDNPQQGKKPLLDYNRSLEWLALGGTIASHMIAADRYEEWRKKINKESAWAKKFISKVILENQLKANDDADPNELRFLSEDLNQELMTRLQYIDIERDFLTEKYHEATDMGASTLALSKYKEALEILSKISNYRSLNEIDFADWLILGGRWILNGESKENIEYILKLFDESESLSNISKKAHDLLNLFVAADRPIPLEQQLRLVVNAGSTKEADLIISSAADSLEFRASQAKNSKLIAKRISAYRKNFDELNSSSSSMLELLKAWDTRVQTYENKYFTNKLEEASECLGQMLALTENLALKLLEIAGLSNKETRHITSGFSSQKQANEDLIKAIFGDHRHSSGLFAELADKLKSEKEFDFVSKLGEMYYYCHLAIMTITIDNENEVINQLSVFFDQYLNVHEEDYPPYMFHKLCAGEAYGFNINYFMSPNLREKMFKLAYNSGIKIYRLLHHLLSKRSVLKASSQEYRDALIGDHENGIIPICYQHETICLEERMWDCMRALRNFVRNYHDRHPLPVIIKGATVEDLFCRSEAINQVKRDSLTWVGGLSNIGKHSWDLNCVLRSPLLRSIPIYDEETDQDHYAISVFTPYLGANAEIKQIYTSFVPEVIKDLDYISAYPNKTFDLNAEGFVHALVVLEGELPQADITMSAHTHPQYISMQTLEFGVPETWSFLSMRQMYYKTELSKILAKAQIESLSQIEFYEKEFDSVEAIEKEIIPRLSRSKCEHLDTWILKASKDSGGRGISNQLSLSRELREMAEFIFDKTRTDDVVMQEFVPNNARSLADSEFQELIKEKFVENGTAIENITPYEKMFFAMRSFQSLSGIKGYLFSVNIGSATVNAGQGAKMFYGEPIRIMPLYFAGKVQKLMDEYGDAILKHAIPAHAEDFAVANNLKINQLGAFSNRYMLNGLFDYIPYFYIFDTGRKYKIIAEDNSSGGLNYYYIKNGKRINLCSGTDIVNSHQALEELMKNRNDESYIDIGLAVIELNSGLGQANLLQNTIEELCPENRDLFLEWTIDLAMVGRAYKNYKSSSSFKDISASS